jgi:hypothetical protein
MLGCVDTQVNAVFEPISSRIVGDSELNLLGVVRKSPGIRHLVRKSRAGEPRVYQDLVAELAHRSCVSNLLLTYSADGKSKLEVRPPG